MRGRSSGKTGPPVPGLTRVGGGAKTPKLFLCVQRDKTFPAAEGRGVLSLPSVRALRRPRRWKPRLAASGNQWLMTPLGGHLIPSVSSRLLFLKLSLPAQRAASIPHPVGTGLPPVQYCR